MTAEPTTVLRGRVANGVVVFAPGVTLPDGTDVTVTPTPVAAVPERWQDRPYPPGVEPFPPEMQAELAFWERISADAFQWVLDLEREEREQHGTG